MAQTDGAREAVVGHQLSAAKGRSLASRLDDLALTALSPDGDL
jgi:hypothetical protein